MLDMRMAGKTDAVDHPHALRLGFHAGKLDPGAGGIHLDAVEALIEIEVPPRAAELAVGDGAKTDLLLLLDDLFDLAVFHRLELSGCDLALVMPGACLPQGGGTQQAADMVGAERRLGAFHQITP